MFLFICLCWQKSTLFDDSQVIELISMKKHEVILLSLLEDLMLVTIQQFSLIIIVVDLVLYQSALILPLLLWIN